MKFEQDKVLSEGRFTVGEIQRDIISVEFLYDKDNPEDVMEVLYHAVDKHRGFGKMRVNFVPFGRTFNSAGKSYKPTIIYNHPSLNSRVEIVVEDIGKTLDSIHQQFSD